jgi:hypothetical protein
MEPRCGKPLTLWKKKVSKKNHRSDSDGCRSVLYRYSDYGRAVMVKTITNSATVSMTPTTMM